METNTNVKLPAAPGAVISLIFGILSAVFSCLFVGIVFGILAIVFSGKAKKAHEANPESFSKGSLGMAKAGLIIGIIGLIFSVIYTFIWLFAASTMSGLLFFA
ncbi:MAG: DUF4190 domain-containing protein [Bacteroidales bacterium]